MQGLTSYLDATASVYYPAPGTEKNGSYRQQTLGENVRTRREVFLSTYAHMEGTGRGPGHEGGPEKVTPSSSP